jgi:ABC transporter DrrB family efflux protein
MKAFYAMFKARTMEFVRDTGSFAWSLLFPIIMVFGFAFAFNGNSALFKVGVLGPGDPALSFLKTEQVQFVDYAADKPEAALEKLRHHNLDVVIDTATKTYWVNKESKNSSVVRLLLTKQDGGQSYQEQQVTGQAIRYVDQLVPGVIGMNMLFGCLFGIGFVIVRYRKNGVLKRLKATPVSALQFVLAQGVSRFVIVFLTSIFVFVGTDLFLHFMMKGSYLDLILVMSLGILSMIALGLVFASRFKNEELASGIINLVTWPMMLFSGIFFSLEGTPVALQWVGQAIPITHFLQAARAIMLEGAGLAQVAPDLAFLALFSAACFGLAAWLFKWE